MARRSNRDDADRVAISLAVGYSVSLYRGRAQYEHLGDYPTLCEARSARDEAGRDEYGRRPMIYALVPGRTGIFVE